MISFLNRIFRQDPDDDQVKLIKSLRSQVKSLESKIELNDKIKVVADMQRVNLEKSLDEQEHFQELWLATANTMVTIRGSMADSAENSRNHKNSLAESSINYLQMKGILGNIATSLAQMNSNTQTVASSVSELSEVAENIETFVSQIKSISDQTNLLALNAAIEAARAGEQGRGFAVVADEVRSLALKSAQASQEITSLVKTISEKTNDVSDGIQDAGATSQELSASTDEVSRIVDDFIGLAKTMALSISQSADNGFIQTVKLDHVVWKTDVYRVLWNKSNQDATTFDDHTNCRLGHWYYNGEGLKHYSKLRAYIEMEEPHRQVHAFGIEALNLSKQGDVDAVFKAIEKMESASEKVLDCLTKLELQIQQYHSTHLDNKEEFEEIDLF